MEAIFSFFAVNFDLPVLNWIAENLRCAFLDFWMPLITLLGDAGIFWIITAVVLLGGGAAAGVILWKKKH